MHTITRRLEFDAGHRVYQHESKCAHVHGHRYVVEVEATNTLDDLGRVIDFSVIKSVFGKWIDDNLDHGMILFKDDPFVSVWQNPVMPTGFVGGEPIGEPVGGGALAGQKYYVMDANPTAEHMAEMLFNKAVELLGDTGITITQITVHETPNCRAVYRP